MKAFLMGVFMTMAFSVHAEEVSVKVNGMVCSMCAQGIQKKFKNHPEVENIQVSLDTKIVQLKIAEGKNLSDELITKAIKEAGYNVEKIERK